MNLGSAALEKLLCNPAQIGDLEELVPRVHDSWHVEFPNLTSLPTFEGKAKRLRLCIATEDIVGPVRNGGIGTTYAYLAQLTAELGHDVTILYLKGQEVENGTIDHWVEHYAKLGVTFVPVPDYGAVEKIQTSADRWLTAPYNMMRYLLDHPMDVVHVSEWRGSGYLSLLAKRQGIAFGNTLFIVKTSSPWLWNRLYGSQPLDRLDDLAKTTAERKSVEYADMVIGGSLHLLRWMASQGYRIPRSQTFVQPNVVSFEHLKDLMAHRVVTPGTRLPIDEIVFFGRLEARKGLFTFCQAIKRILRRGGALPPKISFMGKAGARLTARPQQDILDYIAAESAGWPVKVEILTEFQQYDAIRYLLSGARLAVMPSMIENSSLAVYEAAICNIPFVASHSGGTPELIAAEHHGFVLCESHPISLAERIGEAIELGGYIARPSFDNDTILAQWKQFHGDLARGLAEHLLVGRKSRELRKTTTSACVYHVGNLDLLRLTLESLAAQDELPSEVLIAVDSDQLDGLARAEQVAGTFPFPTRTIEAFDFDAGLAFNALADAAHGEFMLFMWEGATLRPEALTALSSVAQASRADVVNYFYRVRPAAGAGSGYLSAIVFGSVTESFFRNDMTSLPLFVRRSAFNQIGGFSTDYRVLAQDHEFVAHAQISGLHCETALMELGTVPAWDEAWLNERCYDQSVSQFRAIRPQLAAVPLAIRELLLMSKGLQARPGSAGPRSKVQQAKKAPSPSPVVKQDEKGTLARLFSAFMDEPIKVAPPAPPAVTPKPVATANNRTTQNVLDLLESAPLDPEGRYLGGILSAFNGEIFGIVIDSHDSDRAVDLDILINGKLASQVSANADLRLAMMLSKPLRGHGFAVSVFSSRFALALYRRTRTVTLRIRGTDITLPSCSVAPPNLKLDGFGLEGYCDSSENGMIRGWIRMPARLSQAVDVSIFIDSRFLIRLSASAPRQDLPDGDGNPAPHGFSCAVPKIFSETGHKLIDVVASETGLHLNRGKLVLDGRRVAFDPAR